MMCVTVLPLLNFLYFLTNTRFSCHRRDDQVLISFKGENLATTTQSNLVFFLRVRDASLVLRKLNGAPSVKATTTDCALLRPRVNSAFAESKAKATSLVPLAKVKPFSVFLVF